MSTTGESRDNPLGSYCRSSPIYLRWISPLPPCTKPVPLHTLHPNTLTLVLVRTGLNSYVCLAKHSSRSPIGKQLFRLFLVLQHNVNLLFLLCVIFLLRQNLNPPRGVCQSRITRLRRNGQGLSVGLWRMLSLGRVWRGI